MAGPRYKVADGVTVCEDCGVVVAITGAHTRFHSVLDACMLATLPVAHPERLSPDYCWRSWPPYHTDTCGCEPALAEVVAEMEGHG
jgi:hypothetical protein